MSDMDPPKGFHAPSNHTPLTWQVLTQPLQLLCHELTNIGLEESVAWGRRLMNGSAHGPDGDLTHPQQALDDLVLLALSTRLAVN